MIVISLQYGVYPATWCGDIDVVVTFNWCRDAEMLVGGEVLTCVRLRCANWTWGLADQGNNEMESDVEIMKVSEMIIAVSGDLFQVVDNKEEMQAHLDLVSTAWNMSLHEPSKRKALLKKFLKKQQKYAPYIEALKGLDWEMRRIMKQKDRLFPQVNKNIFVAEAVETGNNEYIARAYFEEDVVE